LVDHIRLLLRVYTNPAAAMSGILDQGSLLFASIAVMAVTLLLQMPVPFYMPLLVLAVFYVPGIVVLGKAFAGLGGSLGTVFQRDYSPLLTCTGMAWSAAALPLLVARWMLPLQLLPSASIVMALYFVALMFFVVRTVFGTENSLAGAIVGLSWIPLVAATYLWGPLRFVLGWLASPFFLFYAWYYLGGELGNLGAGLRSRQNFRRMLDAAAVNPHDAEAQYQLGLIYQERRQYAEAIRRFTNAVNIQAGETDAHFQLGRIARQQGRLKDALGHFQTVLDQDENHHQSEILRELGALYLDAGQFADAWRELSVYVERRPYDAEGLYYGGRALEGLGRREESVAMYRRAVEAARSAPRYLQRSVAKWSRLAQKALS
jgi:tetratricopeptide (TPR) repeat protein